MSTLSAIEISGTDAGTFLQGQLTCDVMALTPNSASFMACCDRKGRMVANGFIYFLAPHYYLILPSSTISILLTHLKKYSVFSKVSLSEKTDHAIIQEALLAIKPELSSLSESQLNDALIRASIALIEPKTSGVFTPHMLNWQKQGGVSFTKGCFLGQEVVARTEHLGQLKRHIQRIKLACHEAHEPGDALHNPKQEPIGLICTKHSSDRICLAVLQDKALDETLFCSHQKTVLLSA